MGVSRWRVGCWVVQMVSEEILRAGREIERVNQGTGKTIPCAVCGRRLYPVVERLFCDCDRLYRQHDGEYVCGKCVMEKMREK